MNPTLDWHELAAAADKERSSDLRRCDRCGERFFEGQARAEVVPLNELLGRHEEGSMIIHADTCLLPTDQIA